MANGSVFQDDAEIGLKMIPVENCFLCRSLKRGPVVRMGAIENHLVRRLGSQKVEAENAIALLAHEDFSAGNAASPTPGVAHSLPFRQVSLAAAQRVFGALAFRYVAINPINLM